MKVITKGCLRGKKISENLDFNVFFLKTEMEECDQKIRNFSDKFGVTIPCSLTYFLKAGAPVSLKVATKGYFRGEKPLKI